MSIDVECVARDQHRTFQDAWRHLRRVTRRPRLRHRASERRLAVFRCVHCGYYHVSQKCEAERRSAC
jgi:hypothetical protein